MLGDKKTDKDLVLCGLLIMELWALKIIFLIPNVTLHVIVSVSVNMRTSYQQGIGYDLLAKIGA